MGVNPRPLTLRKLYWMVTGKLRSQYDIAIAQTIYIDKLLGKNGFDPTTANPYRDITEFDLIKTPEQKKDANDTGWLLLRKALLQLKGKSKKAREAAKEARKKKENQ